MEKLLKTVRAYRPIRFSQLCAIVRVVIVREPTISDSEWKAATKELAAKQGYGEPPTEMLTRAMTQVERAIRSTIGPRAIHGDRPPEPHPSTRPIGRTEAAAILERLKAAPRAMRHADIETPEAYSERRRANEKRIPARMVAQEIVESIQRCEALERETPKVDEP